MIKPHLLDGLVIAGVIVKEEEDTQVNYYSEVLQNNFYGFKEDEEVIGSVYLYKLNSESKITELSLIDKLDLMSFLLKSESKELCSENIKRPKRGLLKIDKNPELVELTNAKSIPDYLKRQLGKYISIPLEDRGIILNIPEQAKSENKLISSKFGFNVDKGILTSIDRGIIDAKEMGDLLREFVM